MSIIERHHLEILSALNEQGTLALAAKKLFITQSAISQSIKKLEKQCGVELWQKDGRNIRLTLAGNYLLNVANRVLPQLIHIDDVLKKFKNGSQGSLRIGMECHPCYKWLLHIIAPYLNQWPDVDVDIRKQFTFKGLAALYQYEIDVLITPDVVNRPGVTFYPVMNYEQVLVLSGKHELSKKSWIEPEDMMQQTLITYPIEKHRLDIFKDFMTPHLVVPQKHIHIEDTDILLQMVNANRGVSALPRWLVEEYQEKLDIVPVSLGKTKIYQKIHIGLRSTDMHPDYLIDFLNTAKLSATEFQSKLAD